MKEASGGALRWPWIGGKQNHSRTGRGLYQRYAPKSASTYLTTCAAFRRHSLAQSLWLLRAKGGCRAHGSPKLFRLSCQVLVGLCNARHDPFTFRMTYFISHRPSFFSTVQQVFFIPGQPGATFFLRPLFRLVHGSPWNFTCQCTSEAITPYNPLWGYAVRRPERSPQMGGWSSSDGPLLDTEAGVKS